MPANKAAGVLRRDARPQLTGRSIIIASDARSFLLPIRYDRWLHLRRDYRNGWRVRGHPASNRHWPGRRRSWRGRRLGQNNRLYTRLPSLRHFLADQPHPQRFLGHGHVQLGERLRHQPDRCPGTALGEQHVAVWFQFGESPGLGPSSFRDQAGERRSLLGPCYGCVLAAGWWRTGDTSGRRGCTRLFVQGKYRRPHERHGRMDRGSRGRCRDVNWARSGDNRRSVRARRGKWCGNSMLHECNLLVADLRRNGRTPGDL